MNSKEMRSIAEAYASIYYPQEVDEAITSEKGEEKLKAMLAARTTASGRAKPGKGQNVKDIKHIGRANVDGLGGTPPNLKVAKNPVKSRSYGGTGNAAARRAAALKREEIEFLEENVGMDSKGIMQKPEDADAKVTNDLSKPVKEIPGARPNRDKAMPKLTTGIPDGQPKTSWGEQTEDDIFDLVLEFLIQQEFAEDQEQAIQIMAESLTQDDIETILNEIIDAKGAARMQASKGDKKVDVFAYDRKLQAQGKLKGKKLPPKP